MCGLLWGAKLETYADEAEALFTNFAEKHSLNIVKKSEEQMDLSMIVPQQSGLSFEIMLGLQNNDEINIGIGNFWSYFFPFPEVKDKVAIILDGLCTGDTRLATHTQFNKPVFRDLEIFTQTAWERAYRQVCGFKLPIVSTKITYLGNNTSQPLPGRS